MLYLFGVAAALILVWFIFFIFKVLSNYIHFFKENRKEQLRVSEERYRRDSEDSVKRLFYDEERNKRVSFAPLPPKPLF